jgi:hypothetical protein
MGISGFGNGPVAASLATGVCRGNEAQKVHEFSGCIKARQVTDCRHGGHGHSELHATQGLQGFHHGVKAPGFALCLAFLVEPLEAVSVFSNGADICLKDAVLRRGRTDDLREPSEMCRVPGGLTSVADIMAQYEGCESQLGILQSAEGIFACPREIAHGCIVDLGDRDERVRAPERASGSIVRRLGGPF